MKCVILAGGTGDRLWPLSRKDFPKQFLNFRMERSLFQETITRNLPLCEEFLILTNQAYGAVVEGQLQNFQGLSYRMFLEEEGRGTAASLFAVLSFLPDNEEIFVTPADLLIQGEGYSDAVLAAKELTSIEHTVLLGILPESPWTSVGYISCHEHKVIRFVEKPAESLAEQLYREDGTLWHSGMFVAKAGAMKQAILQADHNLSGVVITEEDLQTEEENRFFLSNALLERLPTGSIEHLILEKSENLLAVELKSAWSDIGSFEAYEKEYDLAEKTRIIKKDTLNTSILNTESEKLVVANGLKDLYIVNTTNALYVTDKSDAEDIKGILNEYQEEFSEYFEVNPKVYRPWGTREVLSEGSGFRIRKIVMYPGRSMSRHIHERRTERYTVVSGALSIEIAHQYQELSHGESVDVLPGKPHRLYNAGDTEVIMIEVDTGSEIEERDMRDSTQDTLQPAELPEIFRLRPAFQNYLWGGNRLKDVFHKESPYEITAESWELSAHPDGQSVIDGGPFSEMKFGAFVHSQKSAVCGWKSEMFDRFPVLIKFIDAKQPLSIQIHPDDDYAFVNEGEFGKNEVWYILDTEPDAYLYCGLSRYVSKEELRKRISDHTITEVLNRMTVKPGDVIFVPAGTIHAIGSGILLVEIQQNSNSTYRVYDYDRVDADGNHRQLHIEKALDVVQTTQYIPETSGVQQPVQKEGYTEQLLAQCKYFRCVKYDVQEEVVLTMDDSSFRSIVVLSGEGCMQVHQEVCELHPGDSFFIRAGRKRIHIQGKCSFIATNI